MIVYTTEEESLPYPAMAVYHYVPTASIAWAVLDDALDQQTADETIFDNDGTTVPWARMENYKNGSPPDELKIVTVIPDSSDHTQIFLIDLDGTATQITNTAADKFNPFLFQNAANGHNMIVYRESPSVLKSDIVILEQQSGTFVEYLRITAADLGEWTPPNFSVGRRYLLSPEPFAVGTTSYVLFSSSDTQDVDVGQEDGRIWVARVSTTLNATPVSVSTDTRPRLEAEVYFPQSGGPIFFYMYRILEDQEEGCTQYGSFIRNNALARVNGVTLP